MKKFHDRFPAKQKNHSFKISGGKFLILSSSALGIISPLRWGNIQLRNPRACSQFIFPLRGNKPGQQVGQQGAQPQKMGGKWVGAALYQGLSLFIKGTWFPSGVFSQWTEEHKKASDHDRLCHVVSGHVCSHILDGKTLNCLLWTIFNGGEF